MNSEELQYELYDIFESGLFAFPVYHHAGARRIVQYLLYRGVPDEEIAGLLVFRRKDLCEAKHDLGVRKSCSKSTLYPLCYAFGGGGVGGGVVKHSILNMF